MKTFVFLTLSTLFFVGCAANPSVSNRNLNDESLTVSAAVSLKDAFNEIGEIYKSRTGNAISFNFGASGALQKQIETGAPVDVFASAGEKQMNELAAKELIDKGTKRDFARNTLVLIAPPDAKTSIQSFSDLVKAEIGKISVGNPKTVPAGQYTEELFNRMNLKRGVERKLILAEDVRQVLDYVVRGETDAGIVYATDARSAGEKVRVVANAPYAAHSPILYPIAIIKDSRKSQAAAEFVNLILSRDGQGILRKYGFASVTDK